MTIVFATNNANKAAEIRPVLPPHIFIKSLKEAGIQEDIPEPFETIEENATAKSRFLKDKYGLDGMAEDTGLEVDALGGAPGVRSARYADGEQGYTDNIDKLLKKMEGCKNRAARFKTVISLVLDGREYCFEGICNGQIIEERRGNMGFGYDPVFVPNGSSKTFAEMSLEEKNEFSHRKKATQKLIDFLANGKD